MKQKIIDESETETEDEVFTLKRKRNKRRNDNVSSLRSNGKNVNKRVKVSGSVGEGKTGKVKVNGSSTKSAEKVTDEWEAMSISEQKRLLKQQIADMVVKAGWTIEYRQRQSRRGYKDAIYTDREGRGYWSVTLAYKKLKERIDKGEGTQCEIAAFTPIPDEKLSLLFRVTTPGAKAGANKVPTGKIDKKVTKQRMSKVSSVDERSVLRTRKVLVGRYSVGKSEKNVTRKVTSEVRSVGVKAISRTRQTLRGRRVGDELDEDGYELYEGKRSLLSWMLDLGTVPLGDKVRYRKGRTKNVLLYGKIVKDGICCDCCNTTHTVQDFGSHAKSDIGNPYRNTYLESGESLLQCIVGSWNKHLEVDSIGPVQVDVEGADDPNDDRCNICGDGGNLICCDNCPSTFHQSCLKIDIPSGDWHCVYCLCKFCGIAVESTSISDGSQDLLSALFTCGLCEEKFHANCTKEKAAEGFHGDDKDPSFCGNDCQKIFEQLQVLLGVRSESDEGLSHTVLQYCEGSGEASFLDEDESVKVENNAKLAVAFSVMNECFEPFIDELSGTNMIHSVVYNRGSNIKRLNYGGFYTIILEKNDEIIAVASLRIRGSQLAEMPFIGTRYAYRRQGMCRRLLTVIETLLNSLGVEKLVIPAIDELHETWTKVFGFHPLEKLTRQEMKHVSMIVFPKTSMLQKPLVDKRSIKTSDVKLLQYKRKMSDKRAVSLKNRECFEEGIQSKA